MEKIDSMEKYLSGLATDKIPSSAEKRRAEGLFGSAIPGP